MPNIFLDVRGLTERLQKAVTRDRPAQGTCIGQGHIALKTLYCPMLVAGSAAAGTFAAMPAVRGRRYYIHSIQLAATKDAAKTGTALYISIVQNGVTRQCAFIAQQTLTAESTAVANIVDGLTDENTTLTVAITGTFSTIVAVVTYQEITTENA